jgi:integrase
MSLYRRYKTWWIRFTTPSGERVRCSARTTSRTQAQELHDKLRAEAWRQGQLKEKPKHTWDEAALKWLKETSHKATHERDKSKIKWLQEYFRGRLLDSIDREMVAKVGTIKAKEAQPATANRYLALVRAILRKAANEWEWLDRVPSIRLYREPKRRVRWITPEQVQVLLKQLPKHQVDVVLFALATGLRRAGIENFRWHDLRHTWASWHVQNGTPLHVVQEMGAWESEAMVRRYAHLAPAHLQRHAEVVSDLLNVTNTAQVAVEKRAA